jgi:hypothetical protein
VYAKLEKRLLEDHRWYMMSEISQLHYIKLILIAQQTYNRIPVECKAIQKAFKTDLKLKTIEHSLNEIQMNFPKFKKSENYYYFENFEEKTNYIRAIPSNAEGVPKDGTDKEKEKKRERKDKDIDDDIDFDYFWDSYDKKVGKPKAKKKWDKLTDQEKEKIFKILPAYINSKPDKHYRKNPEGFLSNKMFNDEIIEVSNGNGNNRKDNGASPNFLRELVTKRAEKERS